MKATLLDLKTLGVHPDKQRRVVIESPYAGDTAANVDYAQECLQDSLLRGEAPIASHLLYPQVLDDTDKVERAIGINAGIAWMNVADAVVVYTDRGISPGMQAAIDRANFDRRPVEYRKLKD